MIVNTKNIKKLMKLKPPESQMEFSGGLQAVYRFGNGYGASVVCHDFSYGHESGLLELAVVVFRGPKSSTFDLSYDTPITDEVLGHLDVGETLEILDRIVALPSLKGDQL